MEKSKCLVHRPTLTVHSLHLNLSCVFIVFLITRLLYSGEVKSVCILISGRLRLISKLISVFKGSKKGPPPSPPKKQFH